MREVVKNTKLTENGSKEVIRAFVEEVIGSLTVEEKIGIMSGQVTEQKLLDDLFLIEHYNVSRIRRWRWSGLAWLTYALWTGRAV